MKISKKFPPNFESITNVFGDVSKHKPVFCYGDTIYNPYDGNLTPDIIHHEKVHSKQQGISPDAWYYKYLRDPEFRLEQEIEAYGEQLKYAKDKGVSGKLYDWAKGNMAMSLSSELYGSLITWGKAESKIRNYKKEIN